MVQDELCRCSWGEQDGSVTKLHSRAHWEFPSRLVNWLVAAEVRPLGCTPCLQLTLGEWAQGLGLTLEAAPGAQEGALCLIFLSVPHVPVLKAFSQPQSHFLISISQRS